MKHGELFKQIHGLVTTDLIILLRTLENMEVTLAYSPSREVRKTIYQANKRDNTLCKKLYSIGNHLKV